MASKSMGTIYNVTVRVIDRATNQIVSEHIGHNQATNTLLTGIAHYLQGDGILNQANAMLSQYIPKYISLGTMGLRNQDESANGLPEGIGTIADPEATEEQQFINYMEHLPGFGADGYDANDNNGRPYFGLGPMYSGGAAVGCELISDGFLRAPITYRTIVPQEYAELPETVDVVFSAMISTGALAQFRNGADHIFISEIGLWNTDKWSNTSQNGLLAGYRIIPASSENWDMTVESNRKKLKESIIRVGINQVVQVIWKIQLGSVEQFGGYVEAYRRLVASLGGEESYYGVLGAGGILGIQDYICEIPTSSSAIAHINLKEYSLENGNFNDSTGAPNQTVSNRVRMASYAKIPDGATKMSAMIINTDADAPYCSYIFYWYSNNTGSYVGYSYQDYGFAQVIIDVPTSAKYFKMLIARTNTSSDINPSQIVSGVVDVFL